MGRSACRAPSPLVASEPRGPPVRLRLGRYATYNLLDNHLIIRNNQLWGRGAIYRQALGRRLTIRKLSLCPFADPLDSRRLHLPPAAPTLSSPLDREPNKVRLGLGLIPCNTAATPSVCLSGWPAPAISAARPIGVKFALASPKCSSLRSASRTRWKPHRPTRSTTPAHALTRIFTPASRRWVYASKTEWTAWRTGSGAPIEIGSSTGEQSWNLLQNTGQTCRESPMVSNGPRTIRQAGFRPRFASTTRGSGSGSSSTRSAGGAGCCSS